MALASSVKLGTEKAERKLWLIRVPAYVATRWRAACCRSMSGADMVVDDDGDSPALGHITITTNPAQNATETMLELAGLEEGDTMPGKYRLVDAADVPAMSAISYDSAPQQQQQQQNGQGQQRSSEADIGKPRLEGTIYHKYDAVPVTSAPTAAAGGTDTIAADVTYRQLSRKRTAASMQKGRTITVISDANESRKLATTTAAPLWSKPQPGRQVVATKEAKLERKRVRMDKDVLEQRLFALFERQPHWHFVQLQRETDQPAAWLKEVLNDLALLNKRGPNRDLWELKRQFRTPGEVGADVAGE